MNKIVFLLLLWLTVQSLNAQIINNKYDINVGYGIGKFIGSEMIKKDGFIAPALYPNFKSLYGISLKGIYLKKQHLSFGVSLNFNSASEWSTDMYSDYINSGVLFYSLSPLAQIHNKSADYGILNRVSFYLELAPTIGLSKLSLSDPLFEIQNGNMQIEQPNVSKDIFFGIKGGVGIKVSINQVIALFLESSAGYYLINSRMYTDSHFTNFDLEAGIILKLKKNKRYFY